MFLPCSELVLCGEGDDGDPAEQMPAVGSREWGPHPRSQPLSICAGGRVPAQWRSGERPLGTTEALAPSAPPIHIHTLVPGGSHGRCCSPRFPQRAGPQRRAVVKGRLGPQYPDLWALTCGLSSMPWPGGASQARLLEEVSWAGGSEQGLEPEGVRRGWKVRTPPAKGHGVW